MGWVCEDHGDRPLMGDSDRADACSFGAGMPCPRCNRDSRHVAHHKHGPALRNEWREAWPTICNWQSLQPSSPRLCSSAVLLLELRKDAITPARQRIPFCGEHCQATERATADIKGHSEAAEYSQPGRLRRVGNVRFCPGFSAGTASSAMPRGISHPTMGAISFAI